MTVIALVVSIIAFLVALLAWILAAHTRGDWPRHRPRPTPGDPTPGGPRD